MPCDAASSRKNSPSTRLPNRRPCMSVKHVRMVSMVPDSTSPRSSSSVSIPFTVPRTSGCIVSVMARLRPRSGHRAALGRRHEVLFVNRPHPPGVPLVGAEDPPKGDDDPDQQDERRVVDGGPVELVLPGDAG